MTGFPFNAIQCFAQEDMRVFYQWMRIEQMDQWLHWFVLAICLVGLVSYVVYWYRKDWVELPKSIGWTLLTLRLLAMIGILIFFFDLQKRTEQRVTRASRLSVLVDTSLSMSMPQQDDTASASGNPTSRISMVQQNFAQSPLLKQLQQNHDVSVYRFDQSARPHRGRILCQAEANDGGRGHCRIENRSLAVAKPPRMGRNDSNHSRRVYDDGLASGTRAGRFATRVALCSCCFCCRGPFRIRDDVHSHSTSRPNSLEQSLEFYRAVSRDHAGCNGNGWSRRCSCSVGTQRRCLGETQLAATGSESRIGDAINSILEQERGAPLAGIVVISDGRNNAGVDPLNTISEATLQGVPIHTVGMGTAKNPLNVRVVDIEAPKRVFPGDRFRLSALLQSSGMVGKQITVQLRRRSGSQKNAGMAIEEERMVNLESDDNMTSLVFDIQPREIGSWIYEVKAIPPEQDSNPLDNALESEVRVVEPKSTVLIIAGGPTREYQFVRNLLFRDPTVQSHVYLQTGWHGSFARSKKVAD